MALIAAVVAVAMVALISSELGTHTNNDLISAANQRDSMRADFLARSAMNLSELIIRLQQRLDNVKLLGGVQITDYADQLMLAFCGNQEEVQAAIGIPSDLVKGLGADIGTCGVTRFDTEDDKINVNCAGGNNATTVKTRIDALIFFPAFDSVFEQPVADGWRRDRDTQSSAILDYVDRDSARIGQTGSPEDYGYESLKDDYLAKNNYIDTVDELRLVRGVDDRFWTLFGNAFTVYGGCKSNLSALKDVNMIASIIYLAAKDPNDPVLRDPAKLWYLAGLVAKARQFGVTFQSEDDFVQFVKDPATAMMAGVTSAATATGQSASTSSIAGVSGQQIGMVLDAKKLDLIAYAGPRRTYRVEAWGEIARGAKNKDGTDTFPPIRRTLTGVWDTKVVTQNARNTTVKNGTWVYLKED